MHHHKNVIAKIVSWGMLCATFSLFSIPAQGAYKIGDDDSYLKIGGLLQGWAAFTEDGAPSGEDWSTELYVRRMRLMFFGQINQWVNFFVETDNPNFGKNGNLSVDTFIQDAYLELNLHPSFQVDVGMLLVPFSHHGMQGATSLLGLDYHGALVKHPAGSTKVWRDFGVMVRGMVTDRFEYRVGVFNGVHGNMDLVSRAGDLITWQEAADPRNHKDAPRLTARVTGNLFEPEGGPGVGGMFYDGIYLKHTDAGVVSTKQILSVGASLDWQRNLNVEWGAIPTLPGETRPIADRSDYLAVAADVFWDLPLDGLKLMSLNGQVNFYYYDYGDRSDGNTYWDTIDPAGVYSTGVGISSEVGFRYDAFQPLVLFDFYNATKAPEANEDLGDIMGIYGGFNYWLFGHATSIKAQFGAMKKNGGDFGMSGTLQAQLLF
ncbi:MAG: porin [Myxococcota bacterium]|nr:porin [Myxococcota bacterium]